jgi:integrase
MPAGVQPSEIERLMDCARKYGRYGHRDATMILVAYRHGLRASEVCDLQWQEIELSEGRLHVSRGPIAVSASIINRFGLRLLVAHRLDAPAVLDLHLLAPAARRLSSKQPATRAELV